MQMDSPKSGRSGGQVAVAVGVTLIGLAYLIGGHFIPDAGGYSTVGPREVPRLIGAVLILLGALLGWEALRGGYRNHDEGAEVKLGFDWHAFGRLSVGIIGYGLLIERAGFIIASTFLFVLAAYAFYSKRWLLNTALAIALAFAIFATFTYGLGLNLPKGVLAGVL